MRNKVTHRHRRQPVCQVCLRPRIRHGLVVIPEKILKDCRRVKIFFIWIGFGHDEEPACLFLDRFDHDCFHLYSLKSRYDLWTNFPPVPQLEYFMRHFSLIPKISCCMHYLSILKNLWFGLVPWTTLNFLWFTQTKVSGPSSQRTVSPKEARQRIQIFIWFSVMYSSAVTLPLLSMYRFQLIRRFRRVSAQHKNREARFEYRGSRSGKRGSRILDRGSRIENREWRIENWESRIGNREARIEDRGSRIENELVKPGRENWWEWQTGSEQSGSFNVQILLVASKWLHLSFEN